MKSQETKHYKVQTSFQSINRVEKSLALKIQRILQEKISFQTFRKYALKSNIQKEYKIL